MTPSDKSYLRYSWFLFGMVFLVIIAGGVVRMTQSGMGCPDWPRCFGMWIPPTDASQLPADFEKYLSKQDIDHTFNVFHTWIEYINRLLGALLGVFIFIYLIWSVRKFWKTDKRFVVISILLFIAVGIQGWLGKLVVEGNLAVFKITIHMLGALIIAALPLVNIIRLKNIRFSVDRKFKILLNLFIVAVLVQIVFGTQVREEIDIISKSLNYENRELWISRLGDVFYLHRSFSWLIVLLSGYLLYASKSISSILKYTKAIGINVLCIIALGIIMSYANMPAVAQPLHLVFACTLLMIGCYTGLVMK